MKNSMKTEYYDNFIYIESGYSSLENFEMNYQGKFIYFKKQHSIERHEKTKIDLSTIDRRLKRDFGDNALRKIFGINTEEFSNAKILLCFEEINNDGNDGIYKSDYKYSHLNELITLKFEVIHPAFHVFQIKLISDEKNNYYKLFLNTIVMNEKYKGKKVFFNIIDRMLFYIFRRTDKFNSLELVGARNEDMFGYSYWPELGFETIDGVMVEGFPTLFQWFSNEDFKKWRELGEAVNLYVDKQLYENYTVSFFEDVRGLIW